MRREVALLGGAYDGELYEVEDHVAYVILPAKVGGEDVVYQRALAIDEMGRPVFALQGLEIRRTA